jgi:hypothetical protein
VISSPRSKPSSSGLSQLQLVETVPPSLVRGGEAFDEVLFGPLAMSPLSEMIELSMRHNPGLYGVSAGIGVDADGIGEWRGVLCGQGDLVRSIVEGHERAEVSGIVEMVQRRPKFVAIAVLVFGVAFGLAFGILASRMTRIYRGATILAPADLDKKSGNSGLGSALGSVGGFAALAGIGLGNDYATEDAIAVLKSEEFTEDFIRDQNLLPELFPKVWDSQLSRWKPGKKVPSLAAGFRAFERIRKIQRDSRTGLITVQIDWKDPVKAAQWTNQLVARLNDEMRNRALTQAEASMGYLQREQSTAVDVAVREAIGRLMESQIKQEMMAHVTKEYALQVIARAIPADVDFPVWPVKPLFVAFGFALGTGAGVFAARWVDKRGTARSA